MSGHSKWSTIKRKKEITDSVRGKLFTRLARGILIAVKSGGGNNPDTNYQLRMAIDTARAANMPKVNIDRILSRIDSAGEMHEITYEGFGLGGVGILVDIATDNKNRSSQEIKQIFERNDGIFAGPGSVAFNFETYGLIVVTSKNVDEDMLKAIDLGAVDVEANENTIDIYVGANDLRTMREKLSESSFDVRSFSLTKKAKNKVSVTDIAIARKCLNLIDILENHEDVQNVYSNIDISDELYKDLAND